MASISIIIQKLSGGGAERVAANMSRELSDKFDIKLIVFDAGDMSYETGGEMIDLKLPPARGIVGQFVNIIRRIARVRNIKKKYNIRCSISLMEGANIVNVFSRRGEKVIISERNVTSFFMKSKLARIREKIVASRADKIVSLSEFVKTDLISEFAIPNEKIQTIYNSVDSNKLLELASSSEEKEYMRFEQGKQYIITMGRLTHQKGQWHLLRAFKAVKEVVPNSKLIILGEGELKGKLQMLIHNLELDDDVMLLGYVRNPHWIIKNADVFVFSSIVEGLGNGLLEAMACGLPVVSTDCDAGPREIIAPDTNPSLKTREIEMGKYGILTPVCKESFEDIDKSISNEENLLAEALVRILVDDNLKKHYSHMSLLRANDFRPEAINKQWENLIHNLVSG